MRDSLDRAEDSGMEPAFALTDGRRILDPILNAHGFVFEPGEIAKGSGGPFATGAYVKGNRRLELHFRWSLGLVTYHFRNHRLSHADYMWSVLGAQGGNRYPGFSDDPLQAFRDLAADLGGHARDFVSGTDEELQARFDHALANPKPVGLKGIIGGGAV
jgi:hypothetical protein